LHTTENVPSNPAPLPAQTASGNYVICYIYANINIRHGCNGYPANRQTNNVYMSFGLAER